jgi:ribosomal protein S12 methylthiotransferase accessory factor
MNNLPRLEAAIASFRAGDTPIAKRVTRGTHRSEPIEDTLRRAGTLAGSVGVTRVATVTGLDTVGLPVVAVYRPNARSVAVAQGKGLDLASATVSGLMEAIEAHHAEHADLPLRWATEREIRANADVIDVDGLARIAGQRFDRDKPLLWTVGTDFASAEPVLVPFEVVHTNFSLPLVPSSGALQLSSNGLASGNHPLEAVSHGLCELVERDCMALFAAEGGVSQSTRRIALKSVDDTDCRKVLAMLDGAELACGIWDITSDIGLAAFLCVIVDRQTDPFRRLYYASGSGCHPQREIALSRALTEAAQCRLTYIAGARDDADRHFFERARDPERVASMRRYVAEEPPNARCFSNVPSSELDTIDEDVRWQLSCLSRAGLHRVVAVDLAPAELGLAVVRVIVPGLEGVSGAAGYTPGVRARRVAQEAT